MHFPSGFSSFFLSWLASAPSIILIASPVIHHKHKIWCMSFKVMLGTQFLSIFDMACCDWSRITFTWVHHWHHFYYLPITTKSHISRCEKNWGKCSYPGLIVILMVCYFLLLSLLLAHANTWVFMISSGKRQICSCSLGHSFDSGLPT